MAAHLVALRGEPVFVADPKTPIGWHILFFGTYEAEVRNLFRCLLRRGCVAVDVGANMGWHTLFMAKAVGEEGCVLAFEPNPSVREILNWHLALNRLPQVKVFPYALSDENAAVRFYGPDADDPHSGDGFVVREADKSGVSTIGVEARSLDSLLSQLQLSRLDLLKLDVEGHELRVLLGCERAIRSFQPWIILEFDESYLKRAGATREMLGDFFRRQCYQVFILSRWGIRAADFASWPRCCELVAAPRGILPTV